MPSKRYYVVFNAHSGAAIDAGLTRQSLGDAFAEAGLDAIIDADMDVSFAEHVDRAVKADADVLVAAGGDGTVTGLAEAALPTGRTIAILPLGTANLLARDLGVPLDLHQWLADLQTMEPHKIDVGVVNGRFFLHKVVIGLIPGIAAAREKLRDRHGAFAVMRFIQFFFQRLTRAHRFAVEIIPHDGEPRVVRVQALAVGSNVYVEGLGRFFARPKLDSGQLTVYLLKHLNAADVFRLLAEMAVGKWHHDKALSVEQVKSVTIRSHKHKVKVMFDGEVLTLNMPLEFSIRPQAISILGAPLSQAAPEPAPSVAVHAS